MSDELAIGLERVRTIFLRTLGERTQSLQFAYADIEASTPQEHTLKTIRETAHNLAGTAKTLGFARLGDEAARTEDAARNYPPLGSTKDSELIIRIEALVNLMLNPK